MKSIGQIFIFSILKTFTERLFLTFCLLFPCLQLAGQIDENFDDNDLTQNPLWSGLTNDFSAANGVLQLKAPAVSGSSYIATQNDPITDVTWQCSVLLEFNPSGSNYGRIYLMSDQPDLNGLLNGYFVMIGNSPDEISLYRQTGSVKTKIIDGTDGTVDLEPVHVTIKVSRSADGEWKLFWKFVSGPDFVHEGSIIDVTHTTSAYTGIQCVYTSTRSDKFFFDDFVVSGEGDTTPPRLETVSAISGNELELTCSEKIDRASAEAEQNYLVDHSVGLPSDAVLSDDGRKIRLSFTGGFPFAVNLTLTVKGLKDVSSNVLAEDTYLFSYVPDVKAAYKDVVISEVMADPSPSVGLPEAEFVELLNRSIYPFDLSNWKISDGKTEGSISSALVRSGEFAILSSVANREILSQYGNVIPVENFPSLNNSGEAVLLKDDYCSVVDSIYFSDSWYKDSDKKGGGYTLEIIDPDNVCAEKSNWVASEDDAGGTPGKINSVDAENPDFKGPSLIRAVAVLPDTIRLIFDEKLSHDQPSRSNFTLRPDRTIQEIEISADLTQIAVVITPGLHAGELLEISMKGIFDCAGNALSESSRVATVILPEAADSLDVVLNEVLFNPRTGGVDFVELLNVSGKYISLEGWSFSNLEDGAIRNLKPVHSLPLYLYPGDYSAFTSDASVLLSEYPKSPGGKVFQSELPPLNDDEGSIALLNPEGKIFDVFYYTAAMHSVFLKDDDGVSLERVSAELETSNLSNWRSAGTTSGYATPGLVNSNTYPENGHHEDGVSVVPEVFIPISGTPAYTRIEYSFDTPAMIGNVGVFDLQGRRVKTIAENELLGSAGFFRWDGDRNDGSKAAIGAYVLRFEIYGSDGVVNNIRKRVVVSGKF